MTVWPLRVALLKLFPPLSAKSCYFRKWGYLYTAMPYGCNVLNSAKPCSDVAYCYEVDTCAFVFSSRG